MSSIYNNKFNLRLYITLFIVIIFVSLFIFLYNINYKNSIKHKIHKRPRCYELPKNIYCYWNNYEEDEFIKLFIENWKKKINSDWNIIIIHKNNLNDYTHNKLDKYSHLDNTKFSDFLRLFLLKEYGGVWVDISTIIINNNFLDIYHKEMLDTKSDVLFYEYKDKTINSKYPYLENWFIIAPKKSKLICDLYDLFEKSFDDGFVKFKKNILMKSGMDLNNTIGYDESIYLMMHACLNYLMYKGNNYKIIVKDASESMFKFQIETSWDNDKLKEKICDKNNYQSMYAIKLVGSQRNYLKDTKNESNEKNDCNINDILLNI
jgi:hypothetical protein